MIRVQEHPIHCIDGKCIYMSKHSIDNEHNSENLHDIYGKNSSHRRLENLGTPIFVVQSSCNSNDSVQEMSGNARNDTISDEMFDLLFDKAQRKSNKKVIKKSNPVKVTQKNRRKSKKN